MKTNKKVLKLMESGFRPSTLQNLTDGQINALYNRIVESSKETKEAVNPVAPDPNRKEFEVSGSAPEKIAVPPNLKNVVVQNKPGETARITLTTGKQKNKSEKVIQDGEMKEDEDVVQVGSIKGGASTQAPHQIQAPDGMDDEGDEEINKAENISEARKKKSKAKNPWAICTATMGKEFGTTERTDWTKPQMKKYERCVMDVKKSIKEGKNPYEVILERQILSLMERELHPRMTKAELLKTISEKKKEVVIIDEAEPAPAPVKPDVKPDTDRKPRRRPGQVPGPDPAPKAKSPEEKKKKYMSLISKILRDEE